VQLFLRGNIPLQDLRQLSNKDESWLFRRKSELMIPLYFQACGNSEELIEKRRKNEPIDMSLPGNVILHQNGFEF